MKAISDHKIEVNNYKVCQKNIKFDLILNLKLSKYPNL
jgi:hypothetical protein